MQRIAVSVPLRQGAEPKARRLVESGPPFNPGSIGLAHHSVFVGKGQVIFVFEGDDVERRLTELVNDPVRAAAFSAWGPVLAGSPCIAREAFYWSREEQAMKKIVIATDGSSSALEAVEYGLHLATEQGAEPIFVHVAPATDVLPVGGFVGGAASIPHVVDEHDRQALDEALEIAARHGVEAKAELLTGDPAREIVAYADSIAADLIVVGSRGQGAIAGALLGSVSRDVLHESRRPVLVVRTAADRAVSMS